MINVTHLHCPAREPAVSGDEKTHYLVPRADGMTCLFCKRTERELREEAMSDAGPSLPDEGDHSWQ